MLLAPAAHSLRDPMSRDSHHVLIAGGGVAAVEAVLALRELVGHRIGVTLLSRERDFLYRPVTVAEAFDRGEARSYPLGEVLERTGGGRLIWDSLEQVDVSGQTVLTGSGYRLPYDSLIIASGAVATEPLPGALTFRGRGDVPALRELLDELAAGEARSVAITMPTERMWTMPVYELALMTSSMLRHRGSDARVWLVTPEEELLELFGPAASEAIMPMLSSLGIRVQTSARPAFVRRRALALMGGAELYVDRVITLPQLDGPALPGLPSDSHGFIPVDAHGRVSGVDHVYAAGDATSFPLKQGGLATQQADAVAEVIASALRLPITPRPFTPVLRGLLLTGGQPLYLRAEPQRLPRHTSVAIEASPRRRNRRDVSAAAGQPLWWPPAKIAGRYLGPFLATATPTPLSTGLLTDRAPIDGSPAEEDEYADAVELALMLADCDAKWGDYRAALDALDAAQALTGALPSEYEHKRRRWLSEYRAA